MLCKESDSWVLKAVVGRGAAEYEVPSSELSVRVNEYLGTENPVQIPSFNQVDV